MLKIGHYLAKIWCLCFYDSRPI